MASQFQALSPDPLRSSANMASNPPYPASTEFEPRKRRAAASSDDHGFLEEGGKRRKTGPSILRSRSTRSPPQTPRTSIGTQARTNELLSTLPGSKMSMRHNKKLSSSKTKNVRVPPYTVHPLDRSATAPTSQSPSQIPYQALLPANTTERSSAAWTVEDDKVLMRARTQGHNWAPIAQLHFPRKTPNACRKRHERLIEKRNSDSWDRVKVEELARAYMECREQMWRCLAEKVGEKWQVIESECMEKGLKNIQNAARRSTAVNAHQSYESDDHFDDSGIGTELSSKTASYKLPKLQHTMQMPPISELLRRFDEDPFLGGVADTASGSGSTKDTIQPNLDPVRGTHNHQMWSGTRAGFGVSDAESPPQLPRLDMTTKGWGEIYPSSRDSLASDARQQAKTTPGLGQSSIRSPEYTLQRNHVVMYERALIGKSGRDRVTLCDSKPSAPGPRIPVRQVSPRSELHPREGNCRVHEVAGRSPSQALSPVSLRTDQRETINNTGEPVIWPQNLRFQAEGAEGIPLRPRSRSVQIGSTFINTLRHYLKTLKIIEPRIEAGKKRLYWSCACGYRSFDDFQEMHPGALAEYDERLRQRLNHPLQGSRSGPSTLARSMSSVCNVLGITAERDESGELALPHYQATAASSGTIAPSTTVTLDPLYLLLCMPYHRYRYATKLIQPKVQDIESDQAFFNLLQCSYHGMRGKFRSLLSMKSLKKIQFVQFEMYESELVDIRRKDDMPLEDRKDEYRYMPMPPDLIPPIGENHMMHLFTHPEHAQKTIVCFDRIPKKLKKPLAVCPSKGTGLGWGIHFIEGWHYNLIWLLAFVLLLLCSLVFLVCWAALKHDVQGASGVAASCWHS